MSDFAFESAYGHGFARVAACTIPLAIADPAANAEAVLASARELHDEAVAVAVFPELCLSGYAIDDLVMQDALLDAVREAIERIAAACVGARIEHDAPFLESAGLPAMADRTWFDRLTTAARGKGAATRQIAARYGTNASVFAAAGVPSLVFGPGSIGQAHTADEWIELAQVDMAAEILAATAS